MNKKYEFSYKNYQFYIQNRDIYEELYTLRDLNIFYSLINLDNRFKNTIVEYEKRIKTIVNEVTLDCSLGSGLCGLGYMYHFMSITNSKYKNEKSKIDTLLKKLVVTFIDSNIPIIDSTGNFNILYDYFKGMSGIFAYVIQTSNDLNVQRMIIDYLIYEISQIDYNEIHANLGIAHGLSCLLNILRLDNNYCYSKNDINIIKKLMLIIEYNLRNNLKKSKRISLSWGNGDFGIVFSILSISKKMNIEISTDLYELIKFIINKGDRIIYEKLNPCNGVFGYKRMLQIITFDDKEIWLHDNQDIAIIGDVIVHSNLKGRDISIIDGLLSKILINNICKMHLNEYYKLFML